MHLLWFETFHYLTHVMVYHKQTNPLTGSRVVSADNIATTVKAWDKQPLSFASINVLDNDGSSGSSVEPQICSVWGEKTNKTENNEKNALNIPDIVLPILVIAPFSSIASMRYNCFKASSNDSAAYYRSGNFIRYVESEEHKIELLEHLTQ